MQVDGITDPLAAPEEFKYFTYTGPLRAAHVTPQVTLVDPTRPGWRAAAPVELTDYFYDGVPRSEEAARDSVRAGAKGGIVCMHAEEVKKMRDTCRIGRAVMDVARRFLRVGVTGDEIDRILHAAAVERGAYPSPLNYRNFPKSVCISPNEVICHGIPDCRPVQDGDIINLDVTVFKHGLHADLNETFLVGNVDAESRKLVKCAYECLSEACAMVRPQTMYRDLGGVISKTAAAGGCSVVRSYCGHGVGRLFHTAPVIPHYAKNKAVGIMRPGHTFTIEPMINLGNSWRDKLWPDNWTAVTADGARSAQFEHTFLVTEDGVDILTARPGAPTDRLVWDEEYSQR